MMLEFRRSARHWLAAIAAVVACDAGAVPRAALDGFVADLVVRHQFDAAAVRRILAGARFEPSILRVMERPPTARSWREYRPLYVNAHRIEYGVKFWRDHEPLIGRISREYGVPEEILVATIGVETYYGRATGRYRVLDALYTLAFSYPPRAEFFRAELEELLLLGRETGFNALQRRGSFAGAMGIAQFLPSSYRRYAVDFDGDGGRDLWRVSDAVASVANYYRSFGWRTGDPVVVPAEVAGTDYRAILERGAKPSVSVGELQRLGVTPRQSLDEQWQATLLETEGDAGPQYWVGLNNFYVITRYNRSVNYALAVHELAAALRRARITAGAQGAPD